MSCVGEGSQTANGSTTSEAQSAAKEKCECKVFTVSGTVDCSYFANDTGTTSDGCSYTKTYSGNPSYTFTTSASSGSVSGNQEGANLLCALASSNNKDKCSSSTTYSYTVDKKPTDSDCKTACGNNNATAIASAKSMLQTRTGSTCSAAKSNATTAWKDFLSSHASNYCHCNPEYPKYMKFKNFQSVSTGYKKSSVDFWVSTDQEVIASIRMDTGDENGYMYFGKMNVKIESNLGNDITNSCYITRSWQSMTRGKSSCQKVYLSGPMIGYQSSGDENQNFTCRFATTFNIQYNGKTYKAQKLTSKTSSNANKKGGQINIWNQSPAGSYAIVGMTQCNDENGYFNLDYAQFEIIES